MRILRTPLTLSAACLALLATSCASHPGGDGTKAEAKEVELNVRDVAPEARVRLLDALSQTGLETIMVGSFVSPKYTPQMAEIDELMQRFTPVDANTIQYEATIEDPKVFTQPWKIRFNAFNRAPKDHQLYEYACHEGNGRNIRLMTGFDIDKGTMAPRDKD